VTPVPVVDHLSADEVQQHLAQYCGVISHNTRRMCTKSLRCPQHTEDQRAAVRTEYGLTCVCKRRGAGRG
jgi:SAGA-associated factor 11